MFFEFLTSQGLLALPMIAFGIFFCTFIGVLLQVSFGWRGGKADRAAMLPLADEERG